MITFYDKLHDGTEVQVECEVHEDDPEVGIQRYVEVAMVRRLSDSASLDLSIPEIGVFEDRGNKILDEESNYEDLDRM